MSDETISGRYRPIVDLCSSSCALLDYPWIFFESLLGLFTGGLGRVPSHRDSLQNELFGYTTNTEYAIKHDRLQYVHSFPPELTNPCSIVNGPIPPSENLTRIPKIPRTQWSVGYPASKCSARSVKNVCDDGQPLPETFGSRTNLRGRIIGARPSSLF